MTGQAEWPGRWVAERFGVRLAGADLPPLVGLALRRNRRRGHLLVSTVLAKHVPTDPRRAVAAGRRLGGLVAARLDGGPPPVVLGYAETATSLGHLVADALPGATYLHSTRREDTGVARYGGFTEDHSHATEHLLLPADPGLLERDGTLLLVDDEVSTGRTLANTIRALHARRPRRQYVVATLVDVRAAADRAELAALAAELVTRIEVVALASGAVRLPDGLAGAVWEYASAARFPEPPAGDPAPVRAVPLDWPDGLPEGGRHGFGPDLREPFALAVKTAAARIAEGLSGGPVLVLGTEELMYAPLRIAAELSADGGTEVAFHSTTRSPVVVVNEPGYAIRHGLRYATRDGERYVYNVEPGRWADIVLVTDVPAPPDLVAGLARAATAGVHVAPLRWPRPLRGPEFSSYRPDEVGWLLTDLSAAPLEAPVEEREEAIQAGERHYAETLPVEYQPSPEYVSLFHAALAESATRLARAVGVVTEMVLAARGPGAVLVSLARAGTPVGVLMRRWARERHGLELAHYALSIVRDRGIDQLALRWLAAHHDPAAVMFVDGWTGKGAISRELAAALAEARDTSGLDFPEDLAVLADPGGCATLYGTREDFLIPSACLNSTVSGLVSRTVLNDLIGPADFHGAKFYAELAGADLSNAFLDAVSAEFGAVAAEVAAEWPALYAADRAPTWVGWAEVERIASAYGIDNLNLVKPGVGETTRVLLRRVPWKVLVRAAEADGPELRHVRLLAGQRGVPVEPVPDLAFRCVGLIRPARSPR
ncbi:MAG: phosphoribosyltransferase [Mycobacteriales bacterium]